MIEVSYPNEQIQRLSLDIYQDFLRQSHETLGPLFLKKSFFRKLEIENIVTERYFLSWYSDNKIVL